jgi:hypothetical protein
MIDITGKTQLIINENTNLSLSRLIDFYETAGLNALFLHGVYTPPMKCNSIKVDKQESWGSLKNKIMDNLFRLDILVIDQINHLKEVKILIESDIKLPTIYCTFNNQSQSVNTRGYISRMSKDKVNSKIFSEYNNAYLFYKQGEIGLDVDDSYWVKDLKNDWKDSFSNLKKKWIRDKKLEELFK